MASVTIWNEYRHEREEERVREVYPEGIHTVLADVLAEYGHDVRTATLDEPEHGLTERVLNETEVLLWWGHLAHDDVSDEIVERVTVIGEDGAEHNPYIDARDSAYETPRTKLDAFVDAIEGIHPVPATTEDALRATAVTEAAYESHRTGEPTSVDLQ